MDDVRHERLADTDVSVRMLVAREAMPAATVEEHRVDEGEVREVPGGSVDVELRDRLDDWQVSGAEDADEREVAEVVGDLQPLGEHQVPDRQPPVEAAPGRPEQHVLHLGVGLDPARLSRVHVLAVRPGRAEQRAEVAVVQREGVRDRWQERDVPLVVVAEREVVVGGFPEAVQRAAVVLPAPALPGVVGVLEGAALEVRRERVGRMLVPVVIGIGEAGVLRVGVGMPAEVVIEGAVLLHEDDEGVDRHVRRARQPAHGLGLRGPAEQRLGGQRGRQARRPGQHGGLGQELAAAQVVLGLLLGEPLLGLAVRKLIRIDRSAHGVTTVSQS